MRIEGLLKEAAQRHGPAVAIVAGKARHTYAELDVKSDRLAFALQSRGFRRGDCLAAFLDGGFVATVSMFAALKAEGMFNPLDPAMSRDDLARRLEQGRAVGIVTQSRLASIAGAALAEARSVRLVVLAGGNPVPPTPTCLSFEEVAGRTSPAPVLAPSDADDAPAVAFGNEAPLSHRKIVLAAPAAAADTSPVWNATGGLLRMIAAIAAGATIVAGTRFDRGNGGSTGVADPQAPRYSERGAAYRDSMRTA